MTVQSSKVIGRGVESGSSVAARFARGTVWLLIGTMASQGLSFIASILCARFLGKEGFGVLGMVQNTVGMFGTFAGLGLGITTTKHVAELRSKDPDRAGRIIGLALAIAALSACMLASALVVFAPYLAVKALHAPHLVVELRIGACLLLLNTLNGPQTAALSGLEAFKAIAQVNVARGLLSVPLIFGGALLGRIRGALWGVVIAASLGWLWNHLAIARECKRRNLHIRYDGVKSEWLVLWSFSVPAFLQSAMVAPVGWIANSVLVNQPGGYAELGLFNAADQWRSLLMFLPQILSGVALPILTSLFASPDRATGKEMDLYHLFNQAIAWPLVAALMLSTHWILRLYGSDFRAGETTMLFVVAGAGVCVIGQTLGTILWARAKMWFGLAANTMWAAILLLIVWLAVPALGALGLALAYLVAHTVLLLVLAIYLSIQKVVTTEFAARIVCSAIGLVLLMTAATQQVHALRHSLTAITVLIALACMALYYGVGRDMQSKLIGFLSNKPIYEADLS